MLKIVGITIPSEAQYLEYFCIIPHKEDSSFWLQDANTQVRGTVKTAHGNCIMPMAPLIKKGVRPALVLADALPVRNKFSFAGVNWTVCSSISKTSFAICDEVIARRIFDPKTNIWEISELRAWLEEWLEYMVMGSDDAVYGAISVDKKPGDICRVGKYDMIILDSFDNQYLLLTKDAYHKSTPFGRNNNFNGSNVDQICAEFAGEIETIVGSENVVERVVSLVGRDGCDDYGTIQRKVSLLEEGEYRKCENVINSHKLDGWWWLATPASVAGAPDNRRVSCISPAGEVSEANCDYFSLGVRPACIISASALMFH